MINSSIEELFNSIENSKEYQEYKKMAHILDKDNKIKEMIEEIKELEKTATMLEESGDPKYKKIDELIKEKSNILESNPIYQEYLNKMEEFNDTLSISSNMIEKYIENKI